MKKTMRISLYAIATCLFCSIYTHAQNVSCEQLVRTVESETTFYDDILWVNLISSEFLEEVKAYQYKDALFVIAKFKREPTAIFSKKYVFCGVPSSNWNAFKNGIGDSYGERFHKYIMDYLCNCN